MLPDHSPKTQSTHQTNLPSQLHRQHSRAIRTRRSRGNRVQDWYNYRFNFMDMNEFSSHFERIFDDQTTVFKLNLFFGFVLFNNDITTRLPITTVSSIPRSKYIPARI